MYVQAFIGSIVLDPAPSLAGIFYLVHTFHLYTYTTVILYIGDCRVCVLFRITFPRLVNFNTFHRERFTPVLN